MASTSTDAGTGDRARSASALRPDPLEPARLERVPGVLGRICRERLADYLDTTELRPAAAADGDAFRRALAAEGLSLIAEVKRASPSQGVIAPLDPVAAAASYARGGAQALSVLTEPRHFGGELAHLEAVASAVALPALRKDFTVHPRQLEETAAAGAAAALLIVAVLGDRLEAYLAYARALGLAALVEVHDEAELALALDAGAGIVGVNNRNLRTLEIDLATAPRLLERARDYGFSGLTVAESGYRQASELRPLLGLADAALVGTSLAGSPDLAAAVARLRRGLGA